MTKALEMFLILICLQICGHYLSRILSTRTSTLIYGFLGGIVSSTALTTSLCHDSKALPSPRIHIHAVSYLVSTLAMLLEALLLVYIGTEVFSSKLLVLFLGPILLTSFFIFRGLKHHVPSRGESKININFFSILKLAGIIVLFLSLSKIAQNFFGDSGLRVLTFLISLFEIHGSVISNVQLFDNHQLSIQLLGELLMLSIAASYLSKVLIVYFLGHPYLKQKVTHWTLSLLISLVMSYLLFLLLISA